MSPNPLLQFGRKSLYRLRRNVRRVQGEVELLRHQGKLDPGRNLALLWNRIRRQTLAIKARIARRGHPDDPYALVTAPNRPRVPRRSGSVAVDPYEY